MNMNNITLTIELCTEDRARVDALIKAIEDLALQPCLEGEAIAGNIEKATKGMKALAGSAKAAADAVASPEPASVEPASVEPAEPAEPAPVEPKPAQPEAAPEVTVSEVQGKVVQLVLIGKKAEARAIVQEYAESVSQIPADKRAEVLERLTALEG